MKRGCTHKKLLETARYSWMQQNAKRFWDALTLFNYLYYNLTRCLKNVKLLVWDTETSARSNAMAKTSNTICFPQATLSTPAAEMTKTLQWVTNKRKKDWKEMHEEEIRRHSLRMSAILAQLKYLHSQRSSQSPLWRKEERNSGFRNSSYSH